MFDPHCWGKESYYDEIARVQKEEMDRREKERKDKTKVSRKSFFYCRIRETCIRKTLKNKCPVFPGSSVISKVTIQVFS